MLWVKTSYPVRKWGCCRHANQPFSTWTLSCCIDAWLPLNDGFPQSLQCDLYCLGMFVESQVCLSLKWAAVSGKTAVLPSHFHRSANFPLFPGLIIAKISTLWMPLLWFSSRFVFIIITPYFCNKKKESECFIFSDSNWSWCEKHMVAATFRISLMHRSLWLRSLIWGD